LGKQALYRRFGPKQDLFAAVIVAASNPRSWNTAAAA
jgi:hypothetical protein